MAPLISPAILIAATLASFSLALVLARLGLAAMFRLLPASRPLVVSHLESFPDVVPLARPLAGGFAPVRAGRRRTRPLPAKPPCQRFRGASTL